MPEQRILEITDCINTALDYTAWRSLNTFDFVDRLPLPSNRRFRRAVRVLDEIVYGIIRKEQGSPSSQGTLLSTLVRARDPETGEAMSTQ